MNEIKTSKQLELYLKADLMINRGVFKKNLKAKLQDCLCPDLIMDYLEALRKASYYTYRQSVWGWYFRLRLRRLGVKLGFSIEKDVFGYGLLIPHWGTIVVGQNTIGKYAVLQSSICISGNGKEIGDGLYMATGAKLVSKGTFGDNIMVGANAVVTKPFENGNVLLLGAPAIIQSESKPWYETQGKEFKERVRKIEELRNTMGL